MLAILAATAMAPIQYVTIQCEKRTITLGEAPVFKISIVNKGRAPTLVVQPNDGSDWHWRTPFTGWAVKSVGDETAWPAQPPRAREPRCGNMNPLTEKELIELKPGEAVEIDQQWLHQKPAFKSRGKYRVVFYYWHVNSHPKEGLEMPSQGSSINDRIIASEPYRLRSNEVVITVK